MRNLIEYPLTQSELIDAVHQGIAAVKAQQQARFGGQMPIGDLTLCSLHSLAAYLSTHGEQVAKEIKEAF